MPDMTISQIICISVVAIIALACMDYRKCGNWQGCEINRQLQEK